MLGVGLGVGDLGAVSTDSSSVGVGLGLCGGMSSVVSSYLPVPGVQSGLSGIFSSDLLSSNLVLGFGFLDLGGGMGRSGCLNGVTSSIVNLSGFMHFFLGSLEGSFSFSKSLFGMLNFILSVTYSSMGFGLSHARESVGFDGGSENSGLGSGFSLGKFVIRDSLCMGSLGILMSGNLGFEGSIEGSFGTSSRQSSLFSTEVNSGLVRSDFIESCLLSYVPVTGGLSVVEGVESIEERKISKNSSGVSGHSRVSIGVREILEFNIGGSPPRIRGVDTNIGITGVCITIIVVGTANITINSDSQSFALELNVNLAPLIHGEGGATITPVVFRSNTAHSNVHSGAVTVEPDTGDSASGRSIVLVVSSEMDDVVPSMDFTLRLDAQPKCFLLASSWSMIPPEVVMTM